MEMDDALNRRQSDAGPFELGGLMQPLEGSEQLRGVGHIESSAVIADEIDGSSPRAGGAEFETRILAFAGEFPGIAQQVV